MNYTQFEFSEFTPYKEEWGEWFTKQCWLMKYSGDDRTIMELMDEYGGFHEYAYDSTHCQCRVCRCNNEVPLTDSDCGSCIRGLHDD